MPQPTSSSTRSPGRLVGVLLAGLVLLLLAGECRFAASLWHAWQEPAYWGAWLAIPLALAVLWRLWPIEFHAHRGTRWVAVLLLGFGLAARGLAWMTAVTWLEGVAVIGCLGLLLFWAGGTRLLVAGAAPLAILVTLVPLPWSWENRLLDPPQAAATVVSTFALQTFGVEAYLDEDAIHVGENPQGLIDPSGRLPNVMAIIALAMGIAFFCRAAWWERALVILSALPVAIALHAARIGLAATAHGRDDALWVDFYFGPSSSWVVLPLAALVFFVEVLLLERLLTNPIDEGRRTRPFSEFSTRPS